MLKRIRYCFGALAILLALAAPAPAYAQGSDPQVDPDSPAGTEYELPLDRARQEAGGGGSGGSSGSSGSRGTTDEAPLFGEGVASGAGSENAKPAPKEDTDPDAATTASLEPDGTSGTPEAVRAQAPSPDGSSGDLVAIGTGAGGVLLLGGLAGLAWRRRSSSEPAKHSSE